MTDARIPLAGVIGDPIAHSRSPKVHGHWLKQHGIAGHYVPLHVVDADLGPVLDALPRMGFAGVNVTLPHKQAVLAMAREVTADASRIGAANTLTFLPEGGFLADNTDCYGFIENLRAGVPDWAAQAGPALVFGAGGACRAVLVGLIDAGVPEILLCNRTRARADALAEVFGGPVRVIDWDDAAEAVPQASLLVNTTSLGMDGADPFPPILDRLQPGTIASDLVYTPLETPFLAQARARGAHCVDGLGMLLYQAVPGFARWFGQRPEVDDALRQAALS